MLNVALRSSPNYKWLVLIIACFSQASAAFASQGVAVLAAFLREPWNLTAMQVGVLVTATSFVPLFTLLFIGNLLDRRSERMVILIGALIMGASLAAATVASGYVELIFFMLLLGAGYSTVQPGGSRSIAVWFKSSQRGFAMGVRQAGLPIGGMLAAVFIPVMIQQCGYCCALLGAGVIVLVGGVIFWLFYRQPEIESAPARVPSASDDSLTLKSSLNFLRQPWMRRTVFAGVVMINAQYTILVFLILYARDTAKMDIGQAALLLATVHVAGIAGRIVLSAWTDRYAPADRMVAVRGSMLATSLGCAVLFVLPGLSNAPIFAWFLTSTWLGFFGLGWYGPWVVSIADTADFSRVGRALGMAMTTNQLAIMLSPLLSGWIFDLSARAAWIEVGFLCIAGWLLVRKLPAI